LRVVFLISIVHKLPSLYGLRAVSITIVILAHLTRFTIPTNQDIMLRIPIFNGQFGVTVFFLISGFLITSLLLQEKERAGSISLKDFYLRRVLRIFPAYYFLLFVYLLLQLTGYLSIPKIAWITSLTYTKYFNPRAEFYTAHFWSLSIEENFYLFWPIILILGDKIRKAVVAYLVLFVPFIRLYVFFYPVDWINDLSIFTRIDSIAMGCYLALYRKEAIVRFQSHWNPFFYGALFILFLLPWLEFMARGTILSLFFIAFGGVSGTISSASIGIILLYSIYGPQRNWYKMLNTRVFNLIGVLSYSLYLWQQLFVLKRAWWVAHFPQNLFCIFFAAIFSFYVIERPFLRLKSRFSGKKRMVNMPVNSSPFSLPSP
jgi:peptidoglycan/LPS O-acetylase OafA/YrhL